jgi:formate dehydrogenase major subunit
LFGEAAPSVQSGIEAIYAFAVWAFAVFEVVDPTFPVALTLLKEYVHQSARRWAMGITRRDFLKYSGGTAIAGAVTGLAPGESRAGQEPNRIKGAAVTTTICPYCAVGCGMIVHTKEGRVIHVEGDPDHPINRGSLCSKGASLFQIANNPTRVKKPMYRAPGAANWKEVEWDWALDEIAKRIKKSRDASFVEKNALGQVVNRCDGIASVGSAALDNEECYVYQKWLRSLGLVYIEHQARI